uniref:Uncharacterized protein n=1 Tax=Tanacetum cinerariifolium TaxID=118510 RepID=A0A699HSF8_TANCI|nr:hypothetical protein [Tanacetum cinerariifolium]
MVLSAKTPWGYLCSYLEDTSKQGRIDEIDADEDIALVNTHDNELQDEGIEEVEEEEVVEVVTTAKMLIDTIVNVAQVITAIVDVSVSAAIVEVVTTAKMLKSQRKQKQKLLLHNNLRFWIKVKGMQNLLKNL